MYIIVSDIVITPHFVINIMTKIMLCPPPPPPPPLLKKKCWAPPPHDPPPPLKKKKNQTIRVSCLKDS